MQAVITRTENTYFNVHVEPTFTFSDHLKLTTLFSYILNRNSQRYYRPYNGVPSFEIPNLGTVTSKTGSLFAKETSVLSNTHLDWANKFGKHDIAATAGFRYTYFSFDSSDMRTQFTSATNDKNPPLNLTGYQDITGANDVWKNMQMYISGDYNYMNRYFATLSLLAEANSRFGENADGLSLINTLMGMRIDTKKRRPILGNTTGGLSGPAIFPVALRMVWQVYEAVKLPIIGMGGIQSADDVIEMMLAGATAVQVGAANLVNPYACKEIIEGLPAAMERLGIQDLNDIIGGAH